MSLNKRHFKILRVMLNNINPSKQYKKLKTRISMKHFYSQRSSYYQVSVSFKAMYVAWPIKSSFQAEFL
jgi:hypothetical protein